MIKRIFPAGLVTSMIASTAFAAALSASGVIETIDTAKNDILLNSGETFMLPAKFDLKTIKLSVPQATLSRVGRALTDW